MYLINALLLLLSFQLCARVVVPFEWGQRIVLKTLHTTEKKSERNHNIILHAYHQKADSVFWQGNGSCSTSTCPLARVFFGRPTFAPESALFASKSPDFTHPFAQTLIAPRFKITDSGVVIGGLYKHKVNDRVNIGVRSSVPWRLIKTKKEPSSLPGSSLFGGQSVADLYVTKTEVVDGTTNAVQDFAIRLDFLSKLSKSNTFPGSRATLLNFKNPAFGPNDPTIGAVDITERLATEANQNPVTVLYSVEKPQEQLGILHDATDPAPPNTARGLQSLASDGSNVDRASQRARFVTGVDYSILSQEVDTLQKLWIVPSVTSTGVLTSRAQIVSTTIGDLVESLDQAPEDIFTDAGLSFDDVSTSGLGDWYSEFFVNYQACKDLWLEGFLGLSIPTGHRISKRKASQIFKLPIGNNGHIEMICGAGAHYVHEYVALCMRGLYGSALSAREYIPASFAGATIKNLGPITTADISWNYIQLLIDCAGHIPTGSEHHILRLNGGYELYHKFKDDISFLFGYDKDLFGKDQLLSSAVAELNSKIRGHTLYINGHYKYSSCLKRSASIDVGGKWVVAGMNMPKLSGFDISLQISF